MDDEIFKGYRAKKLIKEFLNKGWRLRGLKILEITEKNWYNGKTKQQHLTTNCVNGRQH